MLNKAAVQADFWHSPLHHGHMRDFLQISAKSSGPICPAPTVPGSLSPEEQQVGRCSGVDRSFQAIDPAVEIVLLISTPAGTGT